MEEEETLRLSKRIALSYMRETIWDFTTPGLPVEICGDSLLIASWINGVWASEQEGGRPPMKGRDTVKHIFRELMREPTD
eukprot:4365882-Pyramimonas_sp.AAC.1